MGGSPKAKRGVAECNFEVCDNVFNKQTLVIPRDNKDTEETCQGYNIIDGSFLMNKKSDCDAIGGEFNEQTKSCKKKVSYNPTPVKSKVNLGG